MSAIKSTRSTARSAPDAIIVVDVQKAVPVPRAVVRRIEERAQNFRRRIFTRFINEPNSLFRRKLKRSAYPPGADETKLILPTRPDDWVIRKPRYGLAPRDVKRIAAAGIRKVLVCGVDTDACVLGVMFSLFDAGIDCEVDPKLCWSSTGMHGMAVKIMREQFGIGRR